MSTTPEAQRGSKAVVGKAGAPDKSCPPSSVPTMCGPGPRTTDQSVPALASKHGGSNKPASKRAREADEGETLTSDEPKAAKFFRKFEEEEEERRESEEKCRPGYRSGASLHDDT